MNEDLCRGTASKVGDCVDLEVPRHVPCGHTENHHEATKVFAAERAPAFKGRQTSLFSRHGIMAHGIR